MKVSFTQFIISAATAVLLGHCALVAEETKPVLLRYAFAPGQTNVYSVQVEVQGETGRETAAGNLIVSSSSTTTNLIKLSVRGQFRPKNPSMGYMGPGRAVSLASYLSFNAGEGTELVIDDCGSIIRQAGDIALPVPLGQLMLSLVEKFPTEATGGWEREQQAFVLDEPMLQGPAMTFPNASGNYPGMGYYPNRPVQGVLAVRQKIKVRVTESTPETVTLQKTLSLDSQMLTGLEPRVSAAGEGQTVLDRATGWPRRVELQCKTLAVTDNLSRRVVVSLRWQLLEGNERLALLAPSPAPAPTQETKLTTEEQAKLMDQLKSDNNESRQAAVRELGGSRLGTPTPELLSLMVSLTKDRDDSIRHLALTLLANHGTKQHVPLLIKALNDPDAGMRKTIARGLGRLKDPQAAEALANLLASGQNDDPHYYRPPRGSETANALIQIGPAAETIVLAVLKEKSIETRIQVCGVLKQIGTKKSLSALKELTLYPNKELSEAAADACRTIQSKEGN